MEKERDASELNINAMKCIWQSGKKRSWFANICTIDYQPHYNLLPSYIPLPFSLVTPAATSLSVSQCSQQIFSLLLPFSNLIYRKYSIKIMMWVKNGNGADDDVVVDEKGEDKEGGRLKGLEMMDKWKDERMEWRCWKCQKLYN